MTDTINGTAALEACGLSCGYAGKAIVKDLDLALPDGRFTVLLGPNGCGKSTLLRTLAGLQGPLAGEVRLQGNLISSLSSKALARRVSMLAQSPQAPEGLTVSDLVRQGRYPHRRLLGGWSAEDSAMVREAMELTHLTHLKDTLLERLSGGQRQRAWIAMTLAQKGGIMLLDEPTSYLDLAHQIEILSLLRGLVDSRGITAVAVLHDLNLAARYADHLVLLKQGVLQAEGPAETVLTPDRVREVFDVSVTVIADPETGTPLCIPKAVQAG